jgi:hypothetical protein
MTPSQKRKVTTSSRGSTTQQKKRKVDSENDAGTLMATEKSELIYTATLKHFDSLDFNEEDEAKGM